MLFDNTIDDDLPVPLPQPILPNVVFGEPIKRIVFEYLPKLLFLKYWPFGKTLLLIISRSDFLHLGHFPDFVCQGLFSTFHDHILKVDSCSENFDFTPLFVILEDFEVNIQQDTKLVREIGPSIVFLWRPRRLIQRNWFPCFQLNAFELPNITEAL